MTHTREFQTGLTLCGLNALRVRCAKPGGPLPTCEVCADKERARMKAAGARPKLRVRVTYDLVTRQSAEDGDTADGGWIDARTERRRSISNGRKRDVESNMRQARAGKFDFPSLREAMKFIERQYCQHMETCWTGPLGAAGEQTLSVYCTGARDEYESEHIGGSPVVSTDYCLHIDGCSAGTADRIARVLAANGVYFANRRDLQRKRAS